MRYYEATSTISASAAAVWDVLVDGANWPSREVSGDTSGQVAFHLREEYTGPLLPLIWRSMPDLSPSFQRFATGLKQRAESGG